MWVRSLGGVVSWIRVRLARVRSPVAISMSLKHHVGWRNASTLHPRVHCTMVEHVARHHVCSRGRRVLLGAAAAGSGIMAVEVEDFFRALRSLRALLMSLLCGAVTIASTGRLPTFTLDVFWGSRVCCYFRHRATRGHQTGALRAQW